MTHSRSHSSQEMKTESDAKLTLLQILPKESGWRKDGERVREKAEGKVKEIENKGYKQRSNFFSGIYGLKGTEKIHETDFHVSKSSDGAWPI